MACSPAFVKLAYAVIMCMVMVAPLTEAAVTCSTVTSSIAPCIAYLRGSPGPPPACCARVKGLNSAATTPADRKTACTCLKSVASSIAGLDYGKAAGLPAKCGVTAPFPISPNTNCNAVH